MTALPILDDNEREILKDNLKLASLRAYIEHWKITKQDDIDRLLRHEVLPIKLSTRRMCNNEDHCSQHHFFSEMMLNYLPFVVLWANRAGSKTYQFSLITWLKTLMTKNFDIQIVGGSQQQAQKSVEAISKFWGLYDHISPGGLMQKYCRRSPGVENTYFKNGSHIGIQAASEKSTRGPHGDVVFADEADVMDSKILENALSQPIGREDRTGCTWISSTYHVEGGNMSKKIEQVLKYPGGRLFKWCIWDTIESCQKAELSCSTCKFTPYCPGTQMREATGYYKFSDLLKILYSIDQFTFYVEWLCILAGSPDLIYGAALKTHHFIEAAFNPNRQVYLAIDFGVTDPYAVLVFQDFRDTPLNAWVLVDEIYETGKTTPDMIEIAKNRPWWNYIQEIVYDPEGKDSGLQWMRAKHSGIPIFKAVNDIKPGIDSVRAALSPVLGAPKIYIANKCTNTRREFYAYKQKDGKIVDKDNHTCDAFRYFIMRYVRGIDGNTAVAIKKTDDS